MADVEVLVTTVQVVIESTQLQVQPLSDQMTVEVNTIVQPQTVEVRQETVHVVEIGGGTQNTYFPSGWS